MTGGSSVQHPAGRSGGIAKPRLSWTGCVDRLRDVSSCCHNGLAGSATLFTTTNPPGSTYGEPSITTCMHTEGTCRVVFVASCLPVFAVIISFAALVYW